MTGRGGKSDKTLEEMGCSPATINKIVIFGYDKEASLAREFLLRTFNNLNAIMPQEEEDRNRSKKTAEGESLSDLTIRVCGLANLLGGMYYASETRREATKNLLNEALEPSRIFAAAHETEKEKKRATLEPCRDDFQSAIDAKFRIRFQEIIIATLERQLKELKAGSK